MDAIENESILLYNICCGIGISISQRKRNIQFIDSQTTMVNMILNNGVVHSIICGSYSEGSYPFPMPTNITTLPDIDAMHIISGIYVKEHVDTTNTNQGYPLQLLYTDNPEHVLLEVKSYERAYETFNNPQLSWILKVIVGKHRKDLVSSSLFKVRFQRILKANTAYNPSGDYSSCPPASILNINDVRNYVSGFTRNFNQTTIHGPAIMTEQNLSEPINVLKLTSVDTVNCILCYEWPTAAHEWIDRARPHDWPRQDLIDQIKNDGCELVPVGRKDHPDEDVQWKLSFTRAEIRLIRSFNIYQAQCYQLVKLVKSNYISTVVQDSLSSYHIKTVMLHTVEQTDPKEWRKDNLTQCFMICLSNLKRYLEDKFLPHYFIVKKNLLEPNVTGGVHQKVLEIVTDQHKKGWKCILQCPLLQTLCPFIEETDINIPYNIRTDVYAYAGNLGIVNALCGTFLVYILLQQKLVSYKCHLIQIVDLCKKKFLKPTTLHPSVETARVFQLLRKGDLGLLLTVIWTMADPDRRTNDGIERMMNFARQCLEESCHVDVSSFRLKLAMFFFNLGEYARCIATVQDVLERFKDVWVVAGRQFSFDPYIIEAVENGDASKLEPILNRILQLSEKGFPFISNHLSLPVFFTRWEVAVAPKGVQHVHKRMPHNVLISKVCFIDSIVYAHYLLVETFLKINAHDHAEHALINMKESILKRTDDMYDRNCLCYCEEDNLLLQYSERLVQVASVKE